MKEAQFWSNLEETSSLKTSNSLILQENLSKWVGRNRGIFCFISYRCWTACLWTSEQVKLLQLLGPVARGKVLSFNWSNVFMTQMKDRYRKVEFLLPISIFISNECSPRIAIYLMSRVLNPLEMYSVALWTCFRFSLTEWTFEIWIWSGSASNLVWFHKSPCSLQAQWPKTSDLVFSTRQTRMSRKPRRWRSFMSLSPNCQT